jgi:hypothetical protein
VEEVGRREGEELREMKKRMKRLKGRERGGQEEKEEDKIQELFFCFISTPAVFRKPSHRK